jgi:hypothetical protein
MQQMTRSTQARASSLRTWRRRLWHRGSAVTETLVIIGILGLGAAGASITAGTRLHKEYRENRTTLASPFP